MKLIDVNQLSMNFGIENLFTDATFQIKSGNRYGLIGANGTGKTTLLNLLTKTEKPAGGSIVHSGGLKIGYVNQYINFSDELTVNDALMVEYKPIINELIEAEQHLATVAKEDQSKAFKLYEKVRDKYDELECDSLELKIETILDSMNLGSKKMQKIESLSGGEKSVLNLVAALLKTPDLLILDEPGNHLDYLGLAWLEEFLLKFKGTIIVVSHNRYLLDRMCTHILEIDQKKINVFTGSYS
ncbi:MAG: ABC-F family ATP-binding cassette domain-containing protein, partial [bacterium]|nr:ABC-F family ATP-binding cassette domain-containing protein [bacterium]